MTAPRETTDGAARQATPLWALALPSPPAEARAFWRMRRRLVAGALRQTLSHSRLRLSLIGILSTLLWLSLFLLFADGFLFLRNGVPDTPTRFRIVQVVFGMFYAALMVMLAFSSAIILYSSLFRSRDIPLLLTLPARVERVFLHKFQEAILLSSWAFLLLGSPMLLAYGIVAGAPWYYYLLLAPFLVAFTYIPAGMGAIVCLGIVRWLPGGRFHFLVLLGGTVLAAAVWLVWSLFGGQESDILTPSWFQGLLHRLRFSEQRLLPSWWLSMGLLEAARSAWDESILFLALMISNALLFRQLGSFVALRTYRAAYCRLHAHGTSEWRVGVRWVDRVLAIADRGLVRIGHSLTWIGRALGGTTDRLILALPLLPLQTRLLIVKDLRLFRRDPVQWSQFLIFFGLLALYFFNIRRFTYDVHYIGWVNMVSFLNLSVVGLLLSTFTTRFIFPMISLEGRRFWALGLLPVRRERILWSKFLFAALGSIVPCSLLILLSDAMLRVSPVVLGIHQLTCVILSLGLSGIAVGLGAKMPNLREQSPARIAAGFGGTLNLVLSALYIVAVVGLTALPCHFYLAAESSPAAAILTGRAGFQWWLRFWLVAGTAGSLLLGAAATAIPMAVAVRAFRKMEF
jgi:ABC-2 type transport system permease protein